MPADFVTLVSIILALVVGAFFFLRFLRPDSRSQGSRRSLQQEFSKAILETPAAAKPAVESVPVTLESALSETKKSFLGRLGSVFTSGKQRAAIVEEIEEILYTSDLGPVTVQRLMESIEEKLSRSEMLSIESVRQALKSEMSDILSAVCGELRTLKDIDEKIGSTKPRVWLVVGVNGAGKTTTIGKLAGWAAGEGHKVLIAAGDTFRAAAGAQLKMWSERARVEIFVQEGNAKPSGVAFDACKKALAENSDLVILDTAGRLHTQVNLMEELRAVKRAIEKVLPGAPHEVLLVLDANNGQNALIQAKQFHEEVGVTGVILTKLDGTAKGGVAVGLANELKLPVKAIGIGEKIGDLRPFSPSGFVDSIL